MPLKGGSIFGRGQCGSNHVDSLVFDVPIEKSPNKKSVQDGLFEVNFQVARKKKNKSLFASCNALLHVYLGHTIVVPFFCCLCDLSYCYFYYSQSQL